MSYSKYTAFGLIELMLALLFLLTILLPVAANLNQQLKIFTDKKYLVEKYQPSQVSKCDLQSLPQRILIKCNDEQLFFF